MQENWFKAIEQEIFFVLEYKAYKHKLLERLKENSYIIYPQTVYDEDLGVIGYSGQNVERQVLDKIEKEENINKLLSRADQRVERFWNAFNELLNFDQQKALTRFYFERSFRNSNYKLRLQALKVIYEHYHQERVTKEVQLQERLKAERIKKAEEYSSKLKKVE